MSDELKPGVDRPRGWQYAAGVVVILALAALTYWLLRAT